MKIKKTLEIEITLDEDDYDILLKQLKEDGLLPETPTKDMILSEFSTWAEDNFVEKATLIRSGKYPGC
jgi:hypothetical protein